MFFFLHCIRIQDNERKERKERRKKERREERRTKGEKKKESEKKEGKERVEEEKSHVTFERSSHLLSTEGIRDPSLTKCNLLPFSSCCLVVQNYPRTEQKCFEAQFFSPGKKFMAQNSATKNRMLFRFLIQLLMYLSTTPLPLSPFFSLSHSLPFSLSPSFFLSLQLYALFYPVELFHFSEHTFSSVRLTCMFQETCTD